MLFQGHVMYLKKKYLVVLGIVLSTSYLGMTWGWPPNSGAQKPRQRQLPSNGATISAFYGRIFQKL